MRYKLKIEELDYDRNTIKATEVWVTEEMIRSSNSITTNTNINIEE